MEEVCRNFRNTGSCRFGEDCRFEHSQGPPIAHPDRQDRAECFNFRDSGECSHGDRCRFTHGPDDTRGNEPEVCRNYLRGRCENGDACHRLHEGEVVIAAPRRRRRQDVCFAWRDEGHCERGDACQFSHSDEANDEANDEDYEAPAPRAPRTRKPKGPGQCFTFRDEGSCDYGSECRFAHGDIAPTPRPRGECFDFLDGICERGDNCRFSHDPVDPDAPRAPRPTREVVKIDEECNNFKAGTCRQGERCRRQHIE